MAHKFIINNNEIFIGNVGIHDELHTDTMDKKMTIGGGRYYFDHDSKKAYFYGLSMDYGRVTAQQFKDAWLNSAESEIFKDYYDVYFSTETNFVDIKNWILIKKDS